MFRSKVSEGRSECWRVITWVIILKTSPLQEKGLPTSHSWAEFTVEILATCNM